MMIFCDKNFDGGTLKHQIIQYRLLDKIFEMFFPLCMIFALFWYPVLRLTDIPRCFSGPVFKRSPVTKPFAFFKVYGKNLSFISFFGTTPATTCKFYISFCSPGPDEQDGVPGNACAPNSKEYTNSIVTHPPKIVDV